MSAYAIFQIQIKDPDAYKRYGHQAAPTIERYGGEIVALDPHPNVLEGDWGDSTIVVIRFRNPGDAHQWYDSPEYQRAKKIRLLAATANVAIIDG